MTIVKVWGVATLERDYLCMLHIMIANAVESVSELELKEKDATTILFPAISVSRGSGDEIVVEVTGFSKKLCSSETCQKLAEKLGIIIATVYPNRKIECFVSPFSQIDGYWTSDPK